MPARKTCPMRKRPGCATCRKKTSSATASSSAVSSTPSTRSSCDRIEKEGDLTPRAAHRDRCGLEGLCRSLHPDDPGLTRAQRTWRHSETSAGASAGSKHPEDHERDEARRGRQAAQGAGGDPASPALCDRDGAHAASGRHARCRCQRRARRIRSWSCASPSGYSWWS